MLSSGDGDDEDYLLIQGRYEGGLYYVEASDLKYAGHFRIVSARITRDHLLIEWLGRPPVDVDFDLRDGDYTRLRRVLRIMMSPEVVDAC